MNGKTFVDTNILVYARDHSEPHKQAIAEQALRELWETGSGTLSTQVLNEYFVTVTKKLKPGMNEAEAWDDIEALSSWQPWPIDYQTLQTAYQIQNRYQISWWDSLIVAAADSLECDTILSEDLSEGQDYRGMRIVNPFTLN